MTGDFILEAVPERDGLGRLLVGWWLGRLGCSLSFFLFFLLHLFLFSFYFSVLNFSK
jgi:hypothetical protein